MIARTTVIAMVAVPTSIAIPTTIAGSVSAPVVVAAPAIPIGAPARVPEITRTPLRDAPWRGLRISCTAHPRQPKAGGQCDSHCRQTQIIFNHANQIPESASPNLVDASVSSSNFLHSVFAAQRNGRGLTGFQETRSTGT